MRDKLLVELQQRIRGFKPEQDPKAVLSGETWNLARRLKNAVPDLSSDPEVVHALGWLEWYGFIASGGKKTYLEEARRLFRLLLASHPDSSPDGIHGVQEQRVDVLFGLAHGLLERYKVGGGVEKLDQSIRQAERGLRGVPEDNPYRPGYLSNLASLLIMRFEATSSLADVNRAIDLAQRAIDTAAGTDSNQAVYNSTLEKAVMRRFEHTGDQDDLKRAVDTAQKAVVAAGQHNPMRGRYLSNLGGAKLRLFMRTGVLEDLNGAVEAGEQAVATGRKDHTRLGGFLANLGNSFMERFQLQQDMEDLDRGIEAVQKAVRMTPSGHYERPGYLSNLATGLMLRFRHSRRLADIDWAIAIGDEAVSATPEDHPASAARLLTLGNALQTRFARTLEETDADRGLDAFGKAAALASAPMDIRAGAARSLGHLAVTARRWDVAVKGFGLAVNLAALAISPELGRADQEHRLGWLSGLGSEAAAACLMAGHVGRAVELFEQGRAVLFSRVLDARSDLTDLQRTHPDLAERFVHWRHVLDLADSRQSNLAAEDTTSGPAVWVAAERRREAAAGLEEVLTEVRKCPGFERFLLPRPVEELLEAAAEGPLVLLNVASLRSDALILTAGGVEVLPLEGVGPEEVAGQLTAFLEALDTGSEAALAGVLAWLGERVTGPVLDHLGYTAAPPKGGPWPRVWWCPSGALSLLPLHAAGRHEVSDGPPTAVIDRVISSTVPTVRALLRARQGARPGGEPRMLVVAMPVTPGQADLPGVYREADALRELYAGRVDVLGLPGTDPAVYDSVMTALPRHSLVHFSCHGESDLSDPSSSHLLLADHQSRPLTVLDLTGARLQGAELAFLSACTTARTGAALLDEPIHLAAACQLAGYRRVIASLWPISDADTAALTKSFYTTLTKAPRETNAAEALHHATRRLRLLYRDRPSHWAPYTHTGP